MNNSKKAIQIIKIIEKGCNVCPFCVPGCAKYEKFQKIYQQLKELID